MLYVGFMKVNALCCITGMCNIMLLLRMVELSIISLHKIKLNVT